MVRVKGRDDLSSLRYRLGKDFRSATLTSLHLRFLEGEAGMIRSSAALALDAFYKAARKLSSAENAFNQRARPAERALSLMKNMRSPEQLAAMRKFNTAKNDLLAVNEAVAQNIISIIEKDMDLAAQVTVNIRPTAPRP